MIRLLRPMGFIFASGFLTLFATTGELHAQMRGAPMMRGMPMMQLPMTPTMFGRPMPFVINQRTINVRNAPGYNPYSNGYRNPYANGYRNPYSNAYMAGLMYGSAYSSGGGYSSGFSYGGGASGSYTPYNLLPSGAYAGRSRYASSNENEPYDREDAASAEEKRRKAAREQYERSRDNPSSTEILSGKSLNMILSELQTLTADGDSRDLPASELSLDKQGLQHINVSRGAGNVAILKNGGRLFWPVALGGPELQGQRAQLSEQVQEAVKQARSDGQVDRGAILQLASAVDGLRNHLRQNAPSISLAKHVEAKNFLNGLDAAIVGMEQPDAGNYFNGKYALQSKTIPELIKHMMQDGLRFAAAMPGDEAAYAALYRNLAAYHRSVADTGRGALQSRSTSQEGTGSR